MVIEAESKPDEEYTESSSHADVRLTVLRSTIAQQCLESGWHGISESSLSALVDVLDRYLKNMAKRISSFTYLGAREEATVQDFCAAFRDLEPSCTLKELRTFSANVRDCPVEYDLTCPVSNALPSSDEESVYGTPRTINTNGHSRPDWMDEDLDLPPVDEWLPVATSLVSDKQLSVTQPQKTVVLADIIIGDDDEDISEFLAKSSDGPVVPVPAPSTTEATSLPVLVSSAPRKLKSISVVDGKIVTTKTAPVPKARLPVEVKPVRDPKISPLIISLSDRSRKDLKKGKFMEADSKRRRIVPPGKLPSEPASATESLKMKFAKPGKKDQTKIAVTGGDVFFQPKIKEEPKTQPERQDEVTPPVPSPPPASEPVPSIKLKASAVFAKAWKEGKKDQSDKIKLTKEKKTDKDREREREIKRELERQKERQLEAELQQAASVQSVHRHHKHAAVADLEPVHKKHKKHHSHSPSIASTSSNAAVGHDGDDNQIEHLGGQSGKKPDNKRKREPEKVDEESSREVKRVKIKMEPVDDRSRQHKTDKSSQPPPPVSLYAPATQFFPEKDVTPPPPVVNPPVPKLTIPKLTLKLGGKDLKTFKSSIKTEPASTSLISSAASQYQQQTTPYRAPVVTTGEPANFYGTPVGSPLDLSVRKPAPAQNPVRKSSPPPVQPPPPKPAKSKSSSKPAKTHSALSITTSASTSRPSAVSALPRRPTPPPPVVAKIPTPPKPVYVPTPVVAPPLPPSPPVLAESEQSGEVSKIWICPTCGLEDDGMAITGWVCCDTCEEWYHWACLGLKSEPTAKKWYCPPCAVAKMKKNKKKKK